MDIQRQDDDRLEQLLSEALRESVLPQGEGDGPPSSAIVWWRAQMRARQEAARAAERPLAIVHALSIACVAGLLLGLFGLAARWARRAPWSLNLSDLSASPWLVAAVAGTTLAFVVAAIAGLVFVRHD
jgi:hypothetical protein